MEKEAKEKKIVVGFWMRLFSDILDALFLGLFGFLLSFPLKNLFYGMGESGLWIGLLVTFCYTGILQSSIGQGQTIAKKILKIQVVQLDGQYLSLAKSFLRYVVIALIFYNSWIGMGITSMFPFLNNPTFLMVYGNIVFALMIGCIVLVAFHPLKRGIHDLVAGSVVVRKDTYSKEKIEELKNPSRTRAAFIIWIVCSVVIIGGLQMMVNNQKLIPSDMIKEMVSITQKIEQESALKNISMNHNVFQGTNGEKISTLFVSGFLNKKEFDQENFRTAEIKKIVDFVIGAYSRINECSQVVVQVRTGYNIGIWSFYNNMNSSFSKNGELLK